MEAGSSAGGELAILPPRESEKQEPTAEAFERAFSLFVNQRLGEINQLLQLSVPSEQSGQSERSKKSKNRQRQSGVEDTRILRLTRLLQNNVESSQIPALLASLKRELAPFAGGKFLTNPYSQSF